MMTIGFIGLGNMGLPMAGHLAAAGNKMELHDKGGLIANVASGRTMALTRRGGVYVLRLRVSGFPRPGAGR